MLTLVVTVDRDSVCAGDDCASHQAHFSMPDSHDVSEMLNAALQACPLAQIDGGQATWLIDIGGCNGTCIGVMAQQWQEPRLTVPTTMKASILFDERPPALFFRYWCQANPDAVFEAVRTGAALPERYS